MPEPRRLMVDLKALLAGPFFCAECAERLCATVAREPGVAGSACDLDAGTLELRFDPATVGEAELRERLRVLAAEVSGTAGHAAYRLTGLD